MGLKTLFPGTNPSGLRTLRVLARDYRATTQLGMALWYAGTDTLVWYYNILLHPLWCGARVAGTKTLVWSGNTPVPTLWYGAALRLGTPAVVWCCAMLVLFGPKPR
eukprot:3894581-Rhodomonas_salina.1